MGTSGSPGAIEGVQRMAKTVVGQRAAGGDERLVVLVSCVMEWVFAGVAYAGHDREQELWSRGGRRRGSGRRMGFESRRSKAQTVWARQTRVTWRCEPVKLRPSKWSTPRPVLSSRWSCSIRQRIFASRTRVFGAMCPCWTSSAVPYAGGRHRPHHGLSTAYFITP
jgi:hypothetical protein